MATEYAHPESMRRAARMVLSSDARKLDKTDLMALANDLGEQVAPRTNKADLLDQLGSVARPIRQAEQEADHLIYQEKERASAVEKNAKRIAELKAELTDWGSKLTLYPQHQFEWADAAFQAGAELHVRAELQAWIEHNREKDEADRLTDEQVIEEFIDQRLVKEIIRYADTATHTSTGQSHNLFQEAYRLALYAVARNLKWMTFEHPFFTFQRF